MNPPRPLTRFARMLLATAAIAASCAPNRGGGAVPIGGAALQGDLTHDDRAQPAGWAAPISADAWTVDLTVDEPVTIVMCSTTPSVNFDPRLQLDRNGVQVATDDDSAGNLNARIVYTPSESGTYTVYAASVGGTAPPSGASYTLRVMRGAVFDATCPAPGSP
ncbi:MAG: hypothetical protein WCJ30_02090 [Deltaproteobacteria bacterium]